MARSTIEMRLLLEARTSIHPSLSNPTRLILLLDFSFSIWKQPATIIVIPTNSAPQNRTFTENVRTPHNTSRISELHPGRQSGSNPFNVRGVGAKKTKQKTIGNQTSSRTLTRQRREETFTSTSDNRKSVPTHRNMMLSEELPS